MTTLHFTRHRALTSADLLDASLTAQAEEAGRRYDGEDLPASARVVPPDEADEPAFYAPEVWDVTDDDGQVLYQAWFYCVDSGTIFKAGTTEVVAEVIQFGLESSSPLAAALYDAQQRAREAHPDTQLMQMDFR